MADLDLDGHLDLVSGSYWPGDLTLFRGLGGGKFAPGSFLQDRNGGNLNAGPKWKSDKEPEMDSLAASPALVDWDADGDQDLLVGNISGRVILILNEGDAKSPAFGAKRALQAAGQDVQVPGGDAGPEIADWDGDGLWDVLIGAGDGSVWLFRNEGKRAAPALAAGTKLLPGIEWEQSTLDAGAEPTRPGVRAKCSVADWNRDGRPDLLVGDFLTIRRPEPLLTEEQIAERDRLRAEREALSGSHPGDDDEAAVREWSEKYQKVDEALRPLEAGNAMHGFVWVYLRRDAAQAATAAAPVR